jgi:hypothetical protein
VDVDVAHAMGLADLRRVDVGEPVIGDHLAGAVEDEPAQRVALVGIGGDPPVGAVEVLLDGAGHVHQGAAVGAQGPVLLPVDDVGSRRLKVIRGDERLLHHVLDVFDLRGTIAVESVAQDLDDLGGQQPCLKLRVLAAGAAGAQDGRLDLAGVKGDLGSITLDDPGWEGGEIAGVAGHKSPWLWFFY